MYFMCSTLSGHEFTEYYIFFFIKATVQLTSLRMLTEENGAIPDNSPPQGICVLLNMCPLYSGCFGAVTVYIKGRKWDNCKFNTIWGYISY